MDNAWKDKLRKRFSDYSVPEPEGLWEGIEQGIAGKNRRKLLPVWLLSGLAAAAAVALGVFLPTRRTSEQPENTDRYAQSVQVDTARRTPVESGNDLELVAEPVAEPVEATASRPAAFAVASRRPLLAEAKEVAAEIPSQVKPVETVVEATDESDTEVTEEDVVSIPSEVVVPIPDEPVTEVRNATSSPRFSVGVYNEGGQAAGEQSQGYGMTHTDQLSTRAVQPGTEMAPGGLVRMLSANRASSFDARHHAPIRTGITVAWRMTPHLSLASGLNWTALSSDFEESTVGTRTVVKQDLGYLGVPLRLEAGFHPWKNLRLYAGAGGMVEKGLLASSRTESYIGDHLEETTDGKPDTGGLLWSVGASAGAEYRFNRFLGVYFAPGVEYHFDNGAAVRSAYTEKPLHYNLSLGIRFNFGE